MAPSAEVAKRAQAKTATGGDADNSPGNCFEQQIRAVELPVRFMCALRPQRSANGVSSLPDPVFDHTHRNARFASAAFYGGPVAPTRYSQAQNGEVELTRIAELRSSHPQTHRENNGLRKPEVVPPLLRRSGERSLRLDARSALNHADLPANG